MKQTKKTQPQPLVLVGLLIAAIIAGFLGSSWLINRPKSALAPSTEATTTNASQTGHEHHALEPTTEPINAIDLTSKATVEIDIKDYAFSQKDIKVKKGTIVTWTNRDIVEHNVMAAHEHSGEAHGAPSKAEVDPAEFAGPLLVQGESYSFTFTTVGTFAYHCAPHPSMQGSVTVVE